VEGAQEPRSPSSGNTSNPNHSNGTTAPLCKILQQYTAILSRQVHKRGSLESQPRAQARRDFRKECGVGQREAAMHSSCVVCGGGGALCDVVGDLVKRHAHRKLGCHLCNGEAGCLRGEC
jgi:hypothetical protein